MPNVESNKEVGSQDIYKNALQVALVGGALFAGVKGSKAIKKAFRNTKTNFQKTKAGKIVNGIKNSGKDFTPGKADFVGPLSKSQANEINMDAMFKQRGGFTPHDPKAKAVDTDKFLKRWASEEELSRNAVFEKRGGFSPHDASINPKTYNNYVDRWGGADNLSFRQK
ncbi:hypothetical protein U729_3164 (plasmid) [Clostridium baratii str. Sullivan]|uniref:Uncharacterized protein n=1 Tax=Clostridium baratii str. Sullivan TaxID=1415775 RepID=A0A0A7G2J9_9CLOT|nr:hypothetical protein [Clostridium baratii]AIY85246.1 hypothetical protein U729_3164 [Clostridium baratii str. Sullivan]